MKNFSLLLFSLVCFTSIGYTQETGKIKGDRNLTIKQTYVDDFKKIVVGEDFDVELFYNKKPSVEIEIDDNLHDYINIQVLDSVLTLSSTADIRAKKMSIKVNYGDTFSSIEVKDNAEVRSLTSLEFTNAILKTTGSSRAYLNIKTDNFRFISTDKTKVKLNITAENVTAEISDNTKMDALITATTFKMDAYQRASADIEGVVDSLKLRTDNNAKFNGKSFTAKTCTVVAEIASTLYLEVLNDLLLEASGASEIYLYGTPKITIDKFTDTVKLQKKEK